MNIPDEVLQRAHDTGGFNGAFEVIAVWARKEALLEAAELAGSMADNEADAYSWQACAEISAALRELAEGDTE
jgi:hypothetical protein